jgi:hypothetical protein
MRSFFPSFFFRFFGFFQKNAEKSPASVTLFLIAIAP